MHRLWLGLLVALGAWGVVRLLDALLSPRRGAAHFVAGLLYAVNPFVVVYANRSTIFLLGVAALPWLLLAVHRGLRDPRGWFWPALFALIFTATAGGVNAAVPAWLVLAPALFLVYEVAVAGVEPRALKPFLVRVAPLTVAASLWWVAAVAVNSAYGLNFLPFTEQPGTIWQTTSITETLRLMGFWLSYIGVGFGGHQRSYFSDGGVMLFHPAVVVASLLVPALALGGFAWTRRWRYGPWFLALTLVGLLAMVAGFPEGTPLRKALTFAYNRSAAVQFLRTTYKAGPVLALGLACLGGVAAGEAWRRLRAAAHGAAWRRALPAAGAGALAVLLALSAWPLVRGRALDAQMSFDRVPAAWTTAARDLDRTLPRNTRAMVIPGQLYAFYRWGGTVDPVLPGADAPAGGGPFRAALRRPARRRPPVDQRRPDLPAAGAARPARAAALAHGRGRGDHGHRRRPDLERRHAPRRGGGRAGRPARLRAPRRTATARCAASRPRPGSWGRRSRSPRFAATTCPPPASCGSSLAARSPWWTGRRPRSPTWRPSGPCGPGSPTPTPPTSPPPACGPPPGRAGGSSSPTPTGAASSWARACGATRAPRSPPTTASRRTRRSSTPSRTAAPPPRPSRSTAAGSPRCARALLAPAHPVPRAPSLRRPGRRPRPPSGWPTGRWRPRATTWTSGSPARATCPSWTSTPTPTTAARVTAVAVGGRRFAVHPGWNRLRLGLRGCPG